MTMIVLYHIYNLRFDSNITYCAIVMQYFTLCLELFVLSHKLCDIKFITLQEIAFKKDRKLLYGHQCLLFR